MSIRQTPENKWFYRFRYKGEDHCEGGFRTRDQAVRAEIKAKDRAIRDEIHPERSADDATFAEAGALFFEKHGKNLRSGRSLQYQVNLLSHRLDGLRLKEISPDCVEATLDGLQKSRNFKDHTWNHYLATIKVVFNYLKKRRLYSRENPADVVATKKVPRARVRFLYPHEEKLLTPRVFQDARLWPYYYVALHTGMRRSELARIKVADVSLPLRHIFIPYAKNSRSRYVPMSEALARFAETLVQGKGDGDSLLPEQLSTYTGRRFNELCLSAGLRDFKFHDLRHTFAANLLAKGEPIYKVSKIMGHSGVQVTEQHYGHLSMADLKASIDKIDGVVAWPVAMESQWQAQTGLQPA